MSKSVTCFICKEKTPVDEVVFVHILDSRKRICQECLFCENCKCELNSGDAKFAKVGDSISVRCVDCNESAPNEALHEDGEMDDFKMKDMASALVESLKLPIPKAPLLSAGNLQKIGGNVKRVNADQRSVGSRESDASNLSRESLLSVVSNRDDCRFYCVHCKTPTGRFKYCNTVTNWNKHMMKEHQANISYQDYYFDFVCHKIPPAQEVSRLGSLKPLDNI